MPKARIFIVEDQPMIAVETADRLTTFGYEVCGTDGRGTNAAARILELRPDLVLMDVVLAGDIDGIRTAELLAPLDIPIVFLTAHADEETLERAKQTDLYGYLLKPFSESELKTAVEVALYKHQADRKLRESELRYRTLSDAAFEGIGLSDENGAIGDASRRLCDMLGYRREELIGRNVLEFVVPEAREAARNRIAAGIEEPYQLEILRRDGTTFPAAVQARIMERDGRKVRVSAIQDITERKRAEEALRQALISAQEAKNKTDAIIAAMGDGVCIEDRNFRIVYQNQVHRDLIGDFPGQFCYHAYHGRESVCEGCPMELTFQDGAVRTSARTIERNGRVLQLEITVSPVRNAAGSIVAGIEVVRDVSARRAMEERLHRSDEQLRLVVENVSEIIYLVSTGTEGNRHVEFVSASSAQSIGYPPEEFHRNPSLWLSLIHPGDVERVMLNTARILEAATPGTRTYRMRSRHGNEYRWFEDTITPRIEDGQVIGFFGVARDITKRHRAEELVRRYYTTQAAISDILHFSLSDQSLSEILSHALDHILSVDWLSFESRGCIFLTAKEGGELVMAAEKNLSPGIRKACSRILPGCCLCGRAAESRQAIFVNHVDSQHDLSVCEGGPHGHYCVPILQADSLLGVLNVYVKDGHEQQEEDLQFLNAVARTLASIIRRKQVEGEQERLHQELQHVFGMVARSQKEWQETFDSITDMISIHSEDHTITKVNRAFANHFRREPRELVGMKCYDLFHDSGEPVLECPHKRTLRDNQPATEEVGDARTGKVMLVSTFPYTFPGSDKRGTIHIVRDITSEREKEMRLIMSERLAALGTMASGVAHEINNPLSAIAGCTESLLGRVKSKRYDEEFFINYLSIMQEEITRCKRITTSMLSVVRETSYVRRTEDINETLDKTLEIIGLQGRLKTTTLVRDCAPGLPLVYGSEGELKQVFLAIITNALDAMEDSGTVTVGTHVTGGNRVEIRISDTGPGIRPEHLYKVFDPFFTTKTEKGGTGLGLSIARKIISAYNGTIDLESRLGAGTTFIISLPSVPSDNTGT